MSGHPHSRSIAALLVGTTLFATLVVVAVLSAAGGGIVAAGPDAAAGDAERSTTQTEAALVTSNASVGPDESTTLRLSLTEVPDGLAGFELTLELSTPDVAAFEDASYPERYGHTSTPVVAADGQSITVEAVDLHDEVTAGDADVALASVAVRGAAEGETQATVTAVQIDADGGDRIQPALDSGAVRVTADGTADPSTAAAAVGAGDGDGADEQAAADGSRLDPLHLGAAAVLVMASLGAVVAVRLRGR